MKMSNHYFEIDKNNTVKIFINGQEAPIISQPEWPDMTPWADESEATAWAELFIQSIEDPETEFIPGYGPDQPSRPKPAPVDPASIL